MKIYREVMVADRLPKESGFYITNIGAIHFLAGCTRFMSCDPMYWLEEIELPTDDDILNTSIGWKEETRQECYLHGANYILNKIKK